MATGVPGQTGKPLDLERIVDEVDSLPSDYSAWLDRQTGEVYFDTVDQLLCDEDEFRELEDSGRLLFLDLDPYANHRCAERFVGGLGDSEAERRVMEAWNRRGRGRWRRFKDALSVSGLLDQWFERRRESVRQELVGLLRSEGLAFVERPDGGVETAPERTADGASPESRSIQFRETIYSFQIDSNRHVSNIVYIQWMEVGRSKLLEAIELPVHVANEAGFSPVLVETQIQYRQPLHLGDTVEIELWLSELTRLYAIMEFRFRKAGGAEVASGRQKGLFVDLKRGKPKRLTEEERGLFVPYLAEPRSEQP